ncbi:MAG: 2-polyprenyl-6-methoxyphenol hydroxylase-like oxidoreductase, partial [Anaerolineae bacterium]|nr:2-polyprenyl-6-methoxyphenol hydroxylase-like oxidoreductase [Anaerolineae bacterium]
FERLIIVERDRLPKNPEIRNGIPQAHHLHVLLARGHEIFESLFPGMDAELDAKGAPLIEWGYDTTGLGRGGWMPQFHSGIKTRSVSRALLEWHIRERLLRDYPVEFMAETQVTNVVASEDRTRIIGVDVQMRGGSREEKRLLADLVVDASGRTSHAPEWLKSLGYDEPQDTHVNSFLGYSTRWYKKPATSAAQPKGVIISNEPPHGLRAGGLWEVEGDRIVVTLVGINRDFPPTDEAGFMDFARSLPASTIYDTIKDSEPISEIYGYQRTANRLRHFERLSRWPEQFIVIGDAACAFNPVYGQGMTTGALSALELDACLQEHPRSLTGLGMRFQKRLSKVAATPWVMATGEDLRYPGTEGKRPGLMTRIVQKYIDNVQLVMPHDTDVASTFFRVTNLLVPPTALFHPVIVLKTVLNWLGSPRRQSDSPALQPSRQ